jgi:hypothetical protein
MIEKERRDVVVVNREQHIHFFQMYPISDGIKTVKDGFPCRIVLLACVFGVPDGRRVRGANASNDASHVDCDVLREEKRDFGKTEPF